MLEILFGKKELPLQKAEDLTIIFNRLLDRYPIENIDENRKEELGKILRINGYIAYSYQKALNELSPNEVLYAIIYKLKQNGIYKDNKFIFENEKISPLARNGVKNADWIKKEGHDIKLINLAALADGNKTDECGKFIDWLRQLAILPCGNLKNNIYSTTIYLVPFHPRDFGCAYLPRSSDISEKIYDKEIENLTGMDSKKQVKTFIMLSQLCGHPVIYDILPQTGRFSKEVLANPDIVRWFDVNLLERTINAQLENISDKLKDKYDNDDIELVRDIYAQNNGSGDLSEKYLSIYKDIEHELEEIKISLSNDMLKRDNQIKIQKRVKYIVTETLGLKQNSKLKECDITKQIEIISKLINEGLWSAPGGAWCSAGNPVFDYMNECGDYPVFKHYDYKGSDVTELANLDCQTPYYFTFLENGIINTKVAEYFINHVLDIQKEYGFDGFRFDHTDHIVDKVSERDGRPISYRIPRVVVDKLNNTLKQRVPYFATLAEYMLQNQLYNEYHKGMGFEILWGNDIPLQYEKTPENIDRDNKNLANYNIKCKLDSMLSILKTYNNQDGEFNCIDQYPGQLKEDGAIFKWFKYKFLPGGKFAQRPVLYVDGDESFTQKGIEEVISNEVSMKRNDNEDFYLKFNAIDKFVKNSEIISDGEAQVIFEEDDGFVVWMISKEPLKRSYLVVANYNSPTQKVVRNDDTGDKYSIITHGKSVHDKKFNLPGDYSLKGEYLIENGNFKLKKAVDVQNKLIFKSLSPSEFKLFLLERG